MEERISQAYLTYCKELIENSVGQEVHPLGMPFYGKPIAACRPTILNSLSSMFVYNRYISLQYRNFSVLDHDDIHRRLYLCIVFHMSIIGQQGSFWAIANFTSGFDA